MNKFEQAKEAAIQAVYHRQLNFMPAMDYITDQTGVTMEVASDAFHAVTLVKKTKECVTA